MKALSPADGFAIIAYHFPTTTIATFFMMANIIVDNKSYCTVSDTNLMIAMFVFWSLFCFCSRFTDSYTASDGQTYYVMLIPFYGPLCPMLPTEEDKDRVFKHYFVQAGDFFHGLSATLCFLFISIFSNPITMCLFPRQFHNSDLYRYSGTSNLGVAAVAAGPIFVAMAASLSFTCSMPRRQIFGRLNLPATYPEHRQIPDEEMALNPLYKDSDDENDDARSKDSRRSKGSAHSGMSRDSRRSRGSYSGRSAGSGGSGSRGSGSRGRSSESSGPPWRHSAALAERQAERQATAAAAGPSRSKAELEMSGRASRSDDEPDA